MTSVKELFSYDWTRKTKKNFIKQNIRNVRNTKTIIGIDNQVVNESQSNAQLYPKKHAVERCRGNFKKSAAVVYENGNDDDVVLCRMCRCRVTDKRTVAIQTDDDGPECFVNQEVSVNPKQETVKMLENINPMRPPMNYKRGIVPRYLKERNARLQEELKATKEQEWLNEIRGINNPDCPPGHMLIPHEHRLQRLAELKKEHDKLIKELNLIPVSNDSYRIRQRKIQIEKDLIKIEEEINNINRGKVYVKIE